MHVCVLGYSPFKMLLLHHYFCSVLYRGALATSLSSAQYVKDTFYQIWSQTVKFYCKQIHTVNTHTHTHTHHTHTYTNTHTNTHIELYQTNTREYQALTPVMLSNQPSTHYPVLLVNSFISGWLGHWRKGHYISFYSRMPFLAVQRIL